MGSNQKTGRPVQYIDQTVCLQNSCRYEQGKIAFEVASMFVGIGELKAGLQAAKFTKILKAVDNISDQIKVIHHAIHGFGGKFVKTASSGVVDVVMKSGQKVFKCTNGVLSEIRWKTGSGWIQSKVLYGVDYINSTGNKVKNGVLKLYKRTNCRLSADAADDACDWAVEAVGAVIGLAKEIDDVIGKYISKAKFELDGTGPYQIPSNLAVGGHHPMAKMAFDGDANYNLKKAFCVSNATLDKISGIPKVHSTRITPLQRRGYTSLKEKGEKLTIEKMVEIEIKAMTDAKIPEDIAIGWVIKGLEDLKVQNVTKITNIPWNGLN